MSLMTYDLSDDLQMAVRMMGDGRMTLTIWDDRLKERRCCLEWDEVRHLMRTLKACEQVSRRWSNDRDRPLHQGEGFPLRPHQSIFYLEV